jgi:hypothetical protein
MATMGSWCLGSILGVLKIELQVRERREGYAKNAKKYKNRAALLFEKPIQLALFSFSFLRLSRNLRAFRVRYWYFARPKNKSRKEATPCGFIKRSAV